MEFESEAIPQPTSRPLLGNLLDLDIRTPVQSLMKLARDYGPIFRLKLPAESLVVIASADLAKELCDETRFDKKLHRPLEAVRDYAGDGLITARTGEPNWQKAHRILPAAFGGHFLRRMFPAMRDLAEDLVRKWDHFGPRYPINVTEDMTRLTVDTIALCGFGYRLNSFYDPRLHPFVDAMFRSLIESSARTRRLPFVNQFLFNRKRRYANDIRLMHDLADRIIEERQRRPNPDASDILQTMLTARDPESGEGLDNENIRHQMVTFLIAGHETTSGLLSFALLELMKKPASLRAAYDCVDAALGTNRPEYVDLSRLGYLDQVLKETLRLWPTAPAFAVYSKAKETLLGRKFRVSEDETLLLLLPSIHRDPLIWDHPEEFRPERMRADLFKKLPAGAWKPFGNGQRACIGRAFAMQEAVLALALVLQKFDLAAASPLSETGIQESLTLKPTKFMIHARPRAAQAVPTRLARPTANRFKDRGAIEILYGSRDGTAHGYSDELSTDLSLAGFAPTVLALNERAEGLRRDLRSIIITASYDGRAPENAHEFTRSLARCPNDTYKNLRYAVFGCGHRDWERTYQAIPKWIDRRLTELGGAEIIGRGEGDARGDSNTDFRRWKENLLAELCAETNELEILSLGESPPESLGIVTPEGERLLRYFGFEKSVRLRLGGKIQTAAVYFSTLALNFPASAKQREALASYAQCPPDIAALKNGKDERSVLDLLETYPSITVSLSEALAVIALNINL